jgi:UDP-N-acetylglucosamine transferase subunit ALG13
MKIFVVVGTLFPFDRLIRTVDTWAESRKDISITGQIGKSSYVPKNMTFYESLSSKDFNTCFSQSDLIISHAGMGVILKALVENKPLIILPRRLELGEHTTDHQIATAKAFKKMSYVNIAVDEDELLDYLKSPEKISSRYKIGAFASQDLIITLKEFIENN